MEQQSEEQRIGTLQTEFASKPDGSGEVAALSDQEEGDSEEAEVTEEDPLVGTVLSGRYRVEKCLGVGGMGAVYQGEHTLMHKRVAIKVLHPEMTQMTEIVERFEREAMAASHIEHPNVANATDFGKLEEGSFFLVLEFVDGVSLREVIDNGPLGPMRAMHIIEQVTAALVRAHGLGIVHRDLKPENIMLVERDGDPDFVKVLDFGIAKVPVSDLVKDKKAQARALTRAGMVFGTPEYMAPEQALGHQVDPRADIYSLGVIFYEMLAGRLPFEAESPAVVLGMQVSGQPPAFAESAPGRNIPAELERLVMWLLSKDAADRPADAKQLAEALVSTRVALSGQQMLQQSGMTSLPSVDPLSISGAQASVVGMPPVHSSASSPRAQFASAHDSKLTREFDKLRSGLPEPLQKVPGWVLVAAPVVAAVSLLVIVIVVAIVVTSSSNEQAKGSDKSGIVSKVLQASNHAPDAKFEEAREGGIDALERLKSAYPKDERILVELAIGYLTKGRIDEGVGAATRAYEISNSVGDDSRLREACFVAVRTKKGQKPVLELMANGLGTHGLDWLYGVAYGGKAQSKAAAIQAKKMLKDEKLVSRGSRALQAVMALKLARSCQAKKEAILLARKHGDARCIKELKRLNYRKGCGFLGLKDCWPCLRRSSLLKDTISDLTKRIMEQGKQK